MGIFHEMFASFVLLGHTQEDIDQTFSCTSASLRENDAINMSDLLVELQAVYNSQTSVQSNLSVAKISGLFEGDKILRSVPLFSHLRYFHIHRIGNVDVNGKYKSGCMVRPSLSDEWKSIID